METCQPFLSRFYLHLWKSAHFAFKFVIVLPSWHLNIKNSIFTYAGDYKRRGMGPGRGVLKEEMTASVFLLEKAHGQAGWLQMWMLQSQRIVGLKGLTTHALCLYSVRTVQDLPNHEGKPKANNLSDDNFFHLMAKTTNTTISLITYWNLSNL